MRPNLQSFAAALIALLLVAAACGDSGGEDLDEGAVNALVECMSAAQAGVTSSLTEMYATMSMSFPGDEPYAAYNDVPFGVATKVGDLVRIEVDRAAGADAAGEDGDSGPADYPLLMVIEDDTRVYFNLGTFEDHGMPADSPWLAGLDAETLHDGGDLWGLVDLAEVDNAPAYSWVHFALHAIPGTDPLGEDVSRLLALALADGALLEAWSGERTQVMGVDTTPYSFVIDLVALSEIPELVKSQGGDLWGFAASLSGSPGPLPIRYTVHLDDDDVDRRTVVEMDMGAITIAAYAAVDDPDLMLSEEEMRELAQIEFHYAVRLDTHSVDDPALSVTLPDPSRVIDLLPIPLFEF